MTEIRTFDDYLQHANRAWLGQTVQRRGQMFFNVLAEARPDISERVRGGSLDPFHRDDRIPDFLRHVEDRWWPRPVQAEEPR
jgi:hypothetical protein